MTTALGRLRAVPVIAAAETLDLVREDVRFVASDPEHAERCHAVLGKDVLVLGGAHGPRKAKPGLVDMEAIDPEAVEMPADFEPNAGRAGDLAIIFLRASDGELRAAPVTNHRYELSALGAAAACTIKPGDTVYCCIPLHHPTALMASVGSALASGARLALAERFDPRTFDSEIRRTGATLVFYAGDMLRPLLREPRPRSALPVRLFAGSGMRPDLARKLGERFAPNTSILEFYASTTERAILANVDKKKPGALGRVLPGSDPIDVVHVDLANKKASSTPARRGEVGLLTINGRPTNDVVYRDDDGDFWFVDALSGFVGNESTRQIEDILYGELDVDVAAAYGVGGHVWAAYLGEADEARVREVLSNRAEPNVVLRLKDIPLTDGFRARKSALPRTLDDPRILFAVKR